MDTRRIVTALVLALILSGVATYFVYSRMRSQLASRPQLRRVVATARAMPAGAVLKAEDLTIVDWPVSVPLEGSFAKVDEVVGRSLLYPAGEKEPVLERDMAVPGSGIGLTAKIPPGMRATSIRSNEIVGVAGFLFPGSRVDVLATFRGVAGTEAVTQTVLQNVEVITAGQRIQPDPQGKPETVNVVTLLLNPEDAERILLAGSLGTIQFVLRSGADTEKVETRPVTLSELVLGAKKPPAATGKPVRARIVAPPPVKPPQFYTVEVIRGDKKSEEKFQ